jgi:hypothetical protein
MEATSSDNNKSFYVKHTPEELTTLTEFLKVAKAGKSTEMKRAQWRSSRSSSKSMMQSLLLSPSCT